MVGRSAAIGAVMEMALKVAPSSTTVLITGETGTGKELVARALHDRSGRDGLFVPVNVAAIPDTLVESHLFGHIRGAFTGAERAREGVFRTAAGGTLFLDEVGELPANVQAKLLRALEGKEVTPVGTNVPVRTSCRVIAATNRNLVQMAEAGTFRQDLLFRLNVVNIHIPPLRERVEDVPLLVRHFIDHYRAEVAKPVFGIDNEAMQALMAYRWKGNVRELANVIERAVVLCDGRTLDRTDLPAELVDAEQPSGSQDLQSAVEQFKARYIIGVLEHVGGNRAEAAQVLGLSQATLYRELNRLGLHAYQPASR